MTPKDIEILANKNRPMPQYSDFCDVSLFQAFANLYSRLNLHEVQRDQAKIEKKIILQTYARIKSENQRYIEVYKAYQENIRKAGTLLSDIEKSHDTAEIALKACECIGLMTGDKEFLIRQKCKFMEEFKK